MSPAPTRRRARLLHIAEKRRIFFTSGRSRFINEAKSLAKFYTLPGIVSVRDFFLENGTAYIVMEFVEGETLKQRLARVGGKMETSEVFDLLRPLLRSLAEMHAAGLIHRDISPDNIMITPEGNVKLIDFGAARDYLDSGNRSLSVMLKPGYAPEEQYFSRGQQGPWTDIYALCATIYRAITGQTPLESVERLRRDELKAPSALGVSIAPAQEAALLKGLAVLQEDRWQSIPELYQAMYQSEISQVRQYTTRTDPETEPSQPKSPKAEGSSIFARIGNKLRWLWTSKKKYVLISAGVLVLALIVILSIPFFRTAAAYQRVEEYFLEDSPKDAIAGIVALQESSAEKAAELVAAHEEDIYAYGVNQYRADHFDNAEEAFALLPADYERISDYLLLIQVSRAYQDGVFKWKQSELDDPERALAVQLLDLVGFENTNELLMRYHRSAVLFLNGDWIDGSMYLRFSPSAVNPEKAHISQNMSELGSVNGWFFEDSDFYTRNEADQDEKKARFTILDKDTIEIFIYSTENTYTLHRE